MRADQRSAGRLKAVNGTANTYGYDGNGSRVRVTEGDGAALTFYVRSSVLGQAALEVNATGARRAYVYAGRKLVAQQSTDGQFYWLHTNHLGSSRAMTDMNGNLVYKGQFDPYGQALLEWSSASLNTKKFTGYEQDGATGLDYAGARMYNSGRGRFMQPDRLGLGAADVRRPQTLNRYAYTSNDPINFVDPTGLDDIPFIGHVLTIYTSESQRTGVFGSGSDNTSMGIELDPDPAPGGGVGLEPQIDHSAILNAAITRVKERLKTKACKDIFADLNIDGYLANYISISDKDQNGDPFASERVYGSTGKDQYGNVTTVFNQNSSVFTGTQSVIVNGQTITLDMNTMLSTLSADDRDRGLGLRYIDSLAKFQELNVLHELLHAADKDGKYLDTGNSEKTKANNRMIGEACCMF